MHNPDFSKPHYLIETFTRHRLASNLLMIMLALAAGLIAYLLLRRGRHTVASTLAGR